ncbi:hypothetical protein D3C81_894660 [compost metagenome]
MLQVVEDQRNVEGVERAQVGRVAAAVVPVELIGPGGRTLAGADFEFFDGAAPGATGGGGGEEDLRWRVVRIQPAVFGDDHRGQQVRVLLGFEPGRQVVPAQCVVFGVVAQEGAGFVAGVADDHRNVGRLRGGLRPEWMHGQIAGIQHRADVKAAVLDARRIADLYRFQQLFHRQGAQGICIGELEVIEHQPGALGGGAWTSGGDLLAAHGPGAVEQSLRCRHGHQRGDLRATTGLAKYGDVVGIAAEFDRVLTYPVQRLDQIELADIAGIGQCLAAELGQIQVAEQVEAMVDGDDHHVAAPAQVAAVIQRVAARAVVVGAAVDIEQDRPLGAVA